MARRVPLVVHGTGKTVDHFCALLAERHSDLAGCEGIVFEVGEALGPEPSVLVDAGGGLALVLQAVRDGHAAVTADLQQLAAHSDELVVLRSDRRLGLSAALLPGLPLADTILRMLDAGEVVEKVELVGVDLRALTDEAVVTAALLGRELRRGDVRVEGDADAGSGAWRAVVGAGPAVIGPIRAQVPADLRTATVRTRRGGTGLLTVTGRVGDPDQVAGALLADTISLAREADTPWRAHRRRRDGAA